MLALNPPEFMPSTHPQLLASAQSCKFRKKQPVRKLHLGGYRDHNESQNLVLFYKTNKKQQLTKRKLCRFHWTIIDSIKCLHTYH